jgi:hypothetical protein
MYVTSASPQLAATWLAGQDVSSTCYQSVGCGFKSGNATKP